MQSEITVAKVQIQPRMKRGINFKVYNGTLQYQMLSRRPRTSIFIEHIRLSHYI